METKIAAPGTPEAIREIAELIGGVFGGIYNNSRFYRFPGVVGEIHFDPYVNPAHTSMVIKEMRTKRFRFQMALAANEGDECATAKFWVLGGPHYRADGADWMTAVCEAARRTKE